MESSVIVQMLHASQKMQEIFQNMPQMPFIMSQLHNATRMDLYVEDSQEQSVGKEFAGKWWQRLSCVYVYRRFADTRLLLHANHAALHAWSFENTDQDGRHRCCHIGCVCCVQSISSKHFCYLAAHKMAFALGTKKGHQLLSNFLSPNFPCFMPSLVTTPCPALQEDSNLLMQC